MRDEVGRFRQGLALAIAGMALAAGCSKSEAPPVEMVDLAEDPHIAGYPEGPYGTGVGDIIPNFNFQGYVSLTKTSGLASSEPWGDVYMNDLRKSGSKYAAIQLAAYW